MKINNKEFLNPQQQLYENTKDIENLKSKVMEWYNTQENLSNNATTIARTDTNVPDDASTGFLIDAYGHLYKIVGGDETSLLLEYYSNLGNGSPNSELDVQLNGNSIVNNGVANINTQTAYNSSTNKIATMSDLSNILIDIPGSDPIYYHNIRYEKNFFEGNVAQIVVSFVLPSTESTPFDVDDMVSYIKSYLYPAWDRTENAFTPNKCIAASGYIAYENLDLDTVLTGPIDCVVNVQTLGSSTVGVTYGDTVISIEDETYTDPEDNEINCMTDTVIPGTHAFPQPI